MGGDDMREICAQFECSMLSGNSTCLIKLMRVPPLLSLILVSFCFSAFLTSTSQADEKRSQHPKASGQQSDYQYIKMPKKMKLEMVQVLKKGTSSTEARKEALAILPTHRLTKKQQHNVNKITSNIGMFRKFPTLKFEIEPDVYQFFAKHPDVACSIWRVMDISDIEMLQTAANKYDVDMKDGTVGTIEVLHQSPTNTLMICKGKFKSPFLVSPVHATALVHLQAKQMKNKQGKNITIHRANLFVSFPSKTVETAAKLISPISNMMIDRNFHEVSLFTQMMSLAMKRKPGWVEQTARKMEGVLEERKPELVKLTAKVFVNHRKEMLGKAGKVNISLEDVTRPLRQVSAEEEK